MPPFFERKTVHQRSKRKLKHWCAITLNNKLLTVSKEKSNDKIEYKTCRLLLLY